MARISDSQNQQSNLQRLAAQRYLYSRAKRVSALQMSLAIVAPAAGAVAIALCPEIRPWVALVGIVVPLLDVTLLDPCQTRLRRTAAIIQEDLDCNILDLPWNDVLCGRRPAAEDVHEAAEKNRRTPDAPLQDWYPVATDALPMYQARIICQRTNCWWGSKLRQQFRVGILIVLGLVCALVVLLAMFAEWNVQTLVLAVAAPLPPAVMWGVREARRLRDASSDLDRLRKLFESLWDDLAGGISTDVAATSRARRLQDAILLGRRANPLVFDWIYRLKRHDYEKQMKVGAEEMVARLKSTGDGVKIPE